MKLVVKNLSFAYAGQNELWHNVNFTVNSGNIFCIMGANGCGKSTLIRCLIGFLKPSNGCVQIVENNGITYDPIAQHFEFSRRIGYVPQIQNTAYAFSVRDYVVMGRAPHLGLFAKPGNADYEIADQILNEMNIYDIKDRSFNTLSGGQQRQAVIARAIVQQPEIVIMDEPVNHLDYGNQYRVIDMIEKLAQRNIAVILTTHAPDHALYFNENVGVMLNKAFKVGKASEIITEDLLYKLYNLNIKIIDIPEMQRKICIAQKSTN